MRIGILTIVDYSNYGNRLQNYAVNEIIKKYGMNAETIIINNKQEYISGEDKGIKLAVKKLIPTRIFFLLAEMRFKICRDKNDNLRYISFLKFSNSQISQKKYYVSSLDHARKKRKIQKMDGFVAGSDQIWNPYFAGADKYFLTFAPTEKRVAFVASIGVSELPEHQLDRYAKLLQQMKYISVREDSAVDIVEKLIGKKVDCFFDPVLLLEKNRWYSLVRKVNCHVPPKYILSFFLGEVPKKEIEEYARNKGIEVVYMNDKGYEEYYSLDPAQLLYMIQNAEMILTDSFHVTAFSVVFEKQFYVFKRQQEGVENMFSRMETLLSRIGLMQRIQKVGIIEEKADISDKEYASINNILDEERLRFEITMKQVLK